MRVLRTKKIPGKNVRNKKAESGQQNGICGLHGEIPFDRFDHRYETQIFLDLQSSFIPKTRTYENTKNKYM